MSREALVVNCSHPHYNLGAEKLANWLTAEGWRVRRCDGDPGLFGGSPDLLALSVIFSWHAPLARDVALRFGGSDVWCGGPGMAALAHWWRTETGREATLGLDWRFERQRGTYRMTFASRGCPVGCWFCIVPKIEGKEFTLDWDFEPAPILCDNNLSALPTAFQAHILRRYRERGVKLGDANSGFEPRAFDEGTYRRWGGQLVGPWRFAFDETKERASVHATLGILRAESAKRKRVYVLIGNEPIAECRERCEEVIALGGEPYCQYVLPLNWLGEPTTLRHRHDWTWQHGRDFMRFYNRHLWRSLDLDDYRPRVAEPAPFSSVAAAPPEGR